MKTWPKSLAVGVIGGGLQALSAELIDRSSTVHLVELGLVGSFVALAVYWKFAPKE